MRTAIVIFSIEPAGSFMSSTILSTRFSLRIALRGPLPLLFNLRDPASEFLLDRMDVDALRHDPHRDARILEERDDLHLDVFLQSRLQVAEEAARGDGFALTRNPIGVAARVREDHLIGLEAGDRARDEAADGRDVGAAERLSGLKLHLDGGRRLGTLEPPLLRFGGGRQDDARVPDELDVPDHDLQLALKRDLIALLQLPLTDQNIGVLEPLPDGVVAHDAVAGELEDELDGPDH